MLSSPYRVFNPPKRKAIHIQLRNRNITIRGKAKANQDPKLIMSQSGKQLKNKLLLRNMFKTVCCISTTAICQKDSNCQRSGQYHTGKSTGTVQTHHLNCSKRVRVRKCPTAHLAEAGRISTLYLFSCPIRIRFGAVPVKVAVPPMLAAYGIQMRNPFQTFI